MGRTERLTRRRCAGVVLLSVLLVLALLSALAWQLMGRHSLVIAQSRFTFTSDQALEYALGAETFARRILTQDWREGGADQDTLLEPWARATAPFELENGFIEVQVHDLHRCFNLNSLAGDDWQENLRHLKHLLRRHELPDALADAWRDWVDADQEVSPFGAEDGEYLLESPPYRTGDTLAVHESELRLVRGAEPEAMDELRDLVCAVPSTELAINVNTVEPGVLAMLEGADEARLEAFAESERNYDDPQAAVDDLPQLEGVVDALTVKSEYFRISVRAGVDGSRTELTSVVRRDPSNGEVELVSRNFGRDFRSLFTADSEADVSP